MSETFTHAPTLRTVALEQAEAEIIHELGPLTLTQRIAVNRVLDRLIDDVRNRDPWGEDE